MGLGLGLGLAGLKLESGSEFALEARLVRGRGGGGECEREGWE